MEEYHDPALYLHQNIITNSRLLYNFDILQVIAEVQDDELFKTDAVHFTKWIWLSGKTLWRKLRQKPKRIYFHKREHASCLKVILSKQMN